MLGKRLVFLDSSQFMASSLERLVSNLLEDAFKYTSKEFDEDEKKTYEAKRCLSI